MNRWLALALLAANLVVAGWLLARPSAAPPAAGGVPLVEPDGAPRLRLVAELDAAERANLERTAERPASEAAAGVSPVGIEVPAAVPPVDPATTEASPVVEVPVCSSLGPLATRALANALAQRLRNTGLPSVTVREEAGQLRSGYWVYIPPLGTRAAADAMAAEMRAKGAGELFIVTAAEQRHAISLGLFSTADRADQRAAELGKLGYRPRVAERFRDSAVYWLDLREPQGWRFEPDASGGGLPEGAHRVEVPCQTISS
jgi:hypothetical protein